MGMWSTFVDVIQNGILVFTNVFGGSMGTAIIAVSLLIRMALFPLTLKLAHRSFIRNNMLIKLKPELDTLKIHFKNQPDRLTRETMKVFNRNGIKMVDTSNLFGGLIQAPVFVVSSRQYEILSLEAVDLSG